MPRIAASLLAADFLHLEEQVRLVEQAGVDWLHIDVMDGHYVPNLSFGPFIISQLKRITSLPLDVHLMISNPERYIDTYVSAGADLLTVHGEVIGANPRLLQSIRDTGIKSGVALNPDANINDFSALFPHIDLFLVMSVFAGFGGQSFIPTVLDKVRTAVEWRRQHGYRYEISIDGGIAIDTAEPAKAAGVDILVTGTSLFTAPDKAGFVHQLKL
jgi:ribulose-phosphate 3-epimerase